ncbi:asparaginase domain-containing protein [Azospirillum sp. SYSU D00513]|uniref:asparaginase domain-containing protein n=1 Tax=Azospirillum sp. SYSU D00513 TaxID=2812561 RepID=UPI001A965997|nr:asparaginase domain-containing protein [Azospirillum sp. SYSU D00513]
MFKVYVLYTGGTIGSAGTPLAPVSGPDFQALAGSMPGLADGRVTGQPVSYRMDWFERTLDSSDMGPPDWFAIAGRLLEHYADYDGFVVLHGTDTMGYTASALSFLLPGLSKPVIVTGSQVPLSVTPNDALANLTGAILLAGTQAIPECCVYFDSRLMRGNRAVKVSTNQFAAFASPNLPNLATVGIGVTVNRALVRPAPDPSVSLSVPANLQALRARLAEQARAAEGFSVVLLTLYPGIRPGTVEAMLAGTQPPVAGVVIQAYGAGNGPSGADFLEVLSRADARGIVLMDNTQALTGAVDSGAYATGLARAGTVGAQDMTPAASFAKLVALFSRGLAPEEVKRLMGTDLAGELTVPVDPLLL